MIEKFIECKTMHLELKKTMTHKSSAIDLNAFNFDWFEHKRIGN